MTNKQTGESTQEKTTLINYYKCVKCQKEHDINDAWYDGHAMHQSKEGILQKEVPYRLFRLNMEDSKAPIKTTIYFEIRHVGGGLHGNSGKYYFDTEQEAKDEVTEFLKNPTKNNPHMSNDNIEYWRSQSFSIVKKTVTTQECLIVTLKDSKEANHA